MLNPLANLKLPRVSKRKKGGAFLAASCAAVIAVSVATAFGQTAQTHKWQVGETVEVYALNTQTHQYEWKKGVVKDVLAWGGAHVVCSDKPDYIETIGVFNPQDADATPPGINAARYVGYKRGPLTVQEKAQTAGVCPCDPGIRDTTPQNASQTVRFKHLIWENYNAQVDGTLAAPLKVGVTFDTFTIGKSHPNTFSYLGNGVHGLEHSNAKQGEAIYPVVTRFTLWRQYRNALTQTQYDGRFDCFKEKSGAWICGTAAGHQQIGSTH